MDFPGQESGRRPRDNEIDLLRIHYTANKTVPARHKLDLIEVPPDPLAAAKLRIAAVVFLEQLIKLPSIDTGQAIVVKTDEDRPLSGNRAATRVLELPEKTGFSRPPHPDDGMGLVGNLRQSDVAVRQRVLRQPADGGVELLPECVKKGHTQKRTSNLSLWQ